MTINKKMGRRKLLVTSAAFATTTAMGVSPMLAASEADAVRAFYAGNEFTFCDLKYLQNMWGKDNYDSKVFAGQKILAGDIEFFRGELKYAKQIGVKKGIRCEYRDADNPSYRYKDVEKLAKYWNTPTVWDAKLKIGTLLEQHSYNGNKEIQKDLKKAKKG